MIFDDTKELLQKTEDIILDIDKDKKHWTSKLGIFFDSNVVDYICVGLNQLLLKRIFFIAIILTAFLALFIGYSIGAIIVNFVLSLLFAVILAPLTISSKLLEGDVKSEDVEKIKQEISKRKLSANEIQTVKENLSIMETALQNKTSISRWLIGAAWAVFLYCFIQYFLPSVIKGEAIKLKTLQAVALTPPFILMIYSLERSFARTSRRVFMTLLFALNESES